MALHLKRNTQMFAWERCHVTGEYITTGDYYYEDDEDGLIISARVYGEIKKQAREAAFDYSKLERAETERERQQLLRDATREYEYNHILERKIYGKDA